MIPLFPLLWLALSCQVVIVPVQVTLPAQAQFQFRTKVQPLEGCDQAVTCSTSKGTITADTCILVAPLVKVDTTIKVTVTMNANHTEKAVASVLVQAPSWHKAPKKGKLSK